MEPQKIMSMLDQMPSDYMVHSHPAVFTVEDAEKIELNMPGGHCKNMLLTNKKRTTYFLVILEAHKRMNFKQMRKLVGESELKFAKEETLERFDTFAGSVSPFIILEDHSAEIKVYLDKDLNAYDMLNFHPNINTMTLGIPTTDFLKFMKENHHAVEWLEYNFNG